MDLIRDENEEGFFGANKFTKFVREGGIIAGLHERLGGGVVAGKEGGERGVGELGDVEEGLGLAAELDLGMIRNIEAGAVEADVRAQVPRGQRILVRRVAAEDHDGGGGLVVLLGRGAAGVAGHDLVEGGVVGGAVVVDVVGAEDGPSELLEEVVFLVGGAVGANNADGLAAPGVADLAQALAGVGESFLPGGGPVGAVGLAEERGGDAAFGVGEVEGVPALDAEVVAVHAGFVAVVAAHDLGAVGGGADAEGGLAAVAAVGTDGGHVVHLPGAGLVAVGAGGKSADGAGVDAHAALLAVNVGEVIERLGGGDIRRNDRSRPAVLDPQSEDVHRLAAHANAAVAEDAAGAIEVDDGGPLLLFAVVFWLGVEGGGGAVLEGHVLQFALTTGVADGAVEGMIAEQEFECGLACLGDLGGLGRDDHTLGDRCGAGSLELGHLFDADHAHAAGGLEGEAGVVAEGRDLDAGGFAGFDEQGAGGGGNLFAVYGKGYVWHMSDFLREWPAVFLVDGEQRVLRVPLLGVAWEALSKCCDEQLQTGGNRSSQPVPDN